jgi:hypothetical protein
LIRGVRGEEWKGIGYIWKGFIGGKERDGGDGGKGGEGGRGGCWEEEGGGRGEGRDEGRSRVIGD